MTFPLTSGCDPRALDAGEVRIGRVLCNDVLIDGGEGRRGDWLLENADVRIIIRHEAQALTQLGVAGGGIIDAAAWAERDAVEELLPTVDGSWLVEATATDWQEDAAAGLTLSATLADGSTATVDWSLHADDPHIYLDGATGLVLVPPPGATTVGAHVALRGPDDPDGGMLLASDGALEDEGGRLRWSHPSWLVLGAPEAVRQAVWPDGLDVGGLAEGTTVEALVDEQPVARLDVDTDGAFSGRVPADTEALKTTRPGYADGPAVAPGPDLTLGLGEAGSLRVRVASEAGQPLPATLWWGDTAWPLSEGGEVVPVGPGSAQAIVSAGPAWEAIDLGEIEVLDTVEADVLLRPATSPAVLAQLGLTAWPDASTREDPGDLLHAARARGVDFAVAVAGDEIADTWHDDRDAILVRDGSRADSDQGRPLAWPWSPSSRQNAHGAAPWASLGPLDLFAFMVKGGARHVIVDADWVRAAGSPLDWDPRPLAMTLDGLDDLPLYTSLLDQWVPLAPVGPLTWIEGIDPDAFSSVDAEAMLVDGRATATDGPRLLLSVDGATPGDVLDVDQPVVASLQVDAPAWIPLDGAALIGPGGEPLVTWQPTARGGRRLSEQFTLDPPPAWVLAIAWGEDANPPLLATPAWAVTGPVWLSHP